MAIDRNAHRQSKAQSMFNEAMGTGGKSAPKVGKMPMKNEKKGSIGMQSPRRQNVMLAKGGPVRRKEKRAVKHPMMKADGGSVSAQEMAAERHPIMAKKGGSVTVRMPRSEMAEERAEGSKMKVVKRAMGGVGKFRHEAADASGKPKKAPVAKRGIGI